MPQLRSAKGAPLLALALVASAASLATAQTATGAPPSSPQTQSAIKLAGLVTFVANSCPKLQPNYARFSDALNALGVSKADLDKPDLKAGYIGYAARYNTDVKSNCERAEAQFGTHGATLAGIFDPR